MFSGADAPWHWALIIILAIALFGYKKLPDAARAVGRSLRIFRAEMKGMSEDDATRAATPAEIVPPTQVPEKDEAAPPAESARPAPTAAGEQDVTAKHPADRTD
jgi:sec-independent protein translocase protein TatA